MTLGRNRFYIDGDSGCVGALPLRNLKDGAAYAASRAGGENSFCGTKVRGFDESDPGSKKIHADCCRFFEAEIFWFATHARSRHNYAFCVRTVAGESNVAAGAPDFLVDQLFGTLDHDAGKITAGRSWKSGAFHFSKNVFDVAGI